MNESESSREKKGSTKNYIIFGLPRFGSSVVLGIVGFALFFLYTQAYKVNSLLVGFAISMGYISIAASQFLLGWISDQKYTKWGRRKPYIIILTPLLAISFIFLLLPSLFLKDPDEATLFFWLLLWDVIFEASYGVTTPYQSWIAEQFSLEERPKVSQFQNIFNFLGNGVMAVFTLLILVNFKDQVVKDPNTVPIDFLFTIIVFASILISFFYLSAWLMPIEPHYEINSKMMDNLRVILKNKNYILVTVMQGISGLAWVIVTSVMLTYIDIVLNFGTFEYIIAAVFLLIGILSFLYMWRRFITRYGKKQSLLYVFLLAIVFLPTSLIGLIPMSSTLIFGILFIIGIAAILGGWFLFPYIMYADLAEDDQKKTGELKAGIYVGFPSIILNLFQAVGIFLLGMVTLLPNVRVRGLSYSLGYVIWGPICSVILIFAWLFTKKFITLDFDWEKNPKEKVDQP